MKTHLHKIIGFIAYFMACSSNAATVIIDDFINGSYDIGTGRPTSKNTSSITMPLAETRVAEGFGPGFWSSTINTGNNTLSYALSLRPGGNPLEGHSFRITYSNSLGNVDLIGFNAFSLNVGSVVGSALLFAYVGAGNPSLDVIPVALNGTGDIEIPFSNMGDVSPLNANSISFLIVPQTLVFTSTFNSLSAVPEPSTVFLSALGSGILLVRRRPR
jgi:hypothetical protein